MEIPRFDTRDLARLYAAGDYKECVGRFLAWIDDFRKLALLGLNKEGRAAITEFVEALYYYLSRPDFGFKVSYVKTLLARHTVITNLIALSEVGSADEWVRRLRRRGNWFPAVLFFANARNADYPEPRRFFDRHPALASYWYGAYFFDVAGFVNEHAYRNLNEHVLFWDERMVPLKIVSNGYMRCTYISPRNDRVYKARFNDLARRFLARVSVRNHPDPGSIAVITGRWSIRNPTYKNRLPFFQDLAQKYRLTLVHVGDPTPDTDASIFQQVRVVAFQGDTLDLSSVEDNDFTVAFFPDVGMSAESRFLCNLRLAPVQIMTTSHPVSTFGAEVDYFLTGKDAELDSGKAAEFYSERLVLIPGIGTCPVVPPYERADPAPAPDPALIACPWGALKFNRDIVTFLRRMQQGSPAPLRFRFLSTLNPTDGNYLPFKADLVRILGKESVELYANLPYAEYMALLEQAAVALDPFPFGGNTSVIDALYLQRPIVTLEGWQFYNRAGPAILRKVGLQELVAKDAEEYVRIALDLLGDATFRSTVEEKLHRVDIVGELDGFSSRAAFVEAIDYLVGHHEALKKSPDRAPLYFG